MTENDKLRKAAPSMYTVFEQDESYLYRYFWRCLSSACMHDSLVQAVVKLAVATGQTGHAMLINPHLNRLKAIHF
jgi:hypothetical protein